MQRGVSALIGAMLFLIVGAASAWQTPKTDALPEEQVMTVRYDGPTDVDMLKSVRSDIERATAKDSKIKVLKVRILSPGGPVISSLEIARLLRDASDAGLVVEIHAEALCASGCTFVLAAGTPGKRYISRYALFLVHPPQRGGGWGELECVNHVAKPKTQDDKITDALLDLMVDSYARYTGKDRSVIEDWLTCGNENVGSGQLAVTMGLADQVE